MKITFQKIKRSTEVQAIHCPVCGERVRSVVLLPGCNITGLSVKCKRCGKMNSVEAHDDKIK